jgi:hypothetical protein
MEEPIPPELQNLATRMETLSPSLEVIGVKKPGWQKDSKTPLYLSSYSLEIRDRDTSEVYMITTEKLFTSGIANVDQTQAKFLASARGRFIGMSTIALGVIVLAVGLLFTDVAWVPALVLVAVGIWFWNRARRAVPAGWPTPRESVLMMITGRTKHRG